MWCHYLQVLIEGIFTAVGAFIPVLALMYIHFRIRKTDYQKQKIRFAKAIEAYKSLIDISDSGIQEIYKSTGVKNSEELREKLQHDKNINAAGVIKFLTEQFDSKAKNYTKLTEYKLKINYIDGYNFRVYISGLLNNNFPEEERIK